MSDTRNTSENIVPVKAYEFLEVRALCDEIMSNLCQAKAMLTPLEDDDFMHRFDEVELKHYFYALSTIINGALEAKDEIYHVIDRWEKQSDDAGSEG